MTSFIGYINNALIKLPIYFISHMRIVEEISSIVPFSLFPLYILICIRKNAEVDHLSTLTFVVCRLLVT